MQTRTALIVKNGQIKMKHNSLVEEVPVTVVMKAMGVETDMEIVQLIGTDALFTDALALIAVGDTVILTESDSNDSDITM